MVLGKSKGNKMERDTAKSLSIWMFREEHVLKREPTSGASKYNYCGDVYPQQQINWSHFPFLIETKTGYEQHTPTFWQHTKIIEWYAKAWQESKQHNQYIIFLICQFKGKSALLFTNYQIDIDSIVPILIIPIPTDNDIDWVNVYTFKDLLKLDFHTLFKNEINYR